MSRIPPNHVAHTQDLTDPTLALLLGSGATGPLAALVGAADGELIGARPRQVNHQPGRSTVVQYAAQVAWAGAPATKETLILATGSRIPPLAAILSGDGMRLGAWRWPYDPGLPGLAGALDRGTVETLLGELGLGGGALRLTVRAYRPGRRAVIEASNARGKVFLKVVRPDRVQELHLRHRSLAASLPVPRSLGYSAEGVLVLEALGGTSLRTALTGAAVPLPDGAALTGLLDRLPAELAVPGRRGELVGDHLQRSRHYADVVAAGLPDQRERLEELVRRCAVAKLRSRELPVVAVHGDFYEGQLLLDRGRVNGLLDVDTAGAGHRMDEWATMLAHLSVLGQLNPRAKRINRYGADLLAHVEARMPAGALRARIGAAVLGLATGPFRVLMPRWREQTNRRIALAERWLDGGAAESSVATGHEKTLTGVS